MCQLLGMNSSAAASIRFSFTGFAQRGGCTADHIDGWGIAFYEPSGARSFLANTHPFSREWLGRHWFFAHNGDLQNFHPPLDGSYLPMGSPDSEKAFCYLMQRLRAAYPFPRARLVDCDLRMDLGELNGRGISCRACAAGCRARWPVRRAVCASDRQRRRRWPGVWQG